ncbi:response regulator [Methylomarinovum caldicuralii]|nr:response regulator [Methylomarinovum caldicuralii]
MTEKTRRKILVVDDDRLILSTLSQGLGKLGYEVMEAANAEEALARVRRQRPDLALVDVRMPGIDGPALARRLQEEFGIASLFLSAYDDRDAIEAAAAAGGLGYLTKPCNIQDLVPALELAIHRAHDLAALREREAKLQQALQRNREINVAVGVLMERFRLSRHVAYERLRQRARHHRCNVRELAAQVVQLTEAINSFLEDHRSAKSQR